MRARCAVLAAAAAVAATGGCSWMPGFDDPQISLSPRIYFYKLRGKTKMQSFSGGSVVENPAMDLADFAQRDRDDDLGGIVAYGDGFSGVELFYQKVEMDSTKRGTLTADYGALPRGTEVHPRFNLDEVRIGYTAQLFEHETDDEMLFRVGLGAALVHRDGDFAGVEVDNTGLEQRIDFRDDGVPYATARARVEYQNAGLQADYLLNPDITFGGDFEGVMQDVEITLSYTLEAQDLTFLGGFRWSELKASGEQEGLLYEADMRLEGYFLGLSFTF